MPITSRVYRQRPEAPAPDIIEELASYEVAWLSDATGLNLMDPGIKAVHSSGRTVGTAVTANVQPGSFGLIPWALEVSRPGDFLVVDGGGCTTRANWGDYFSGWAQHLGLVGAVIDGATRDRRGIQEIDFPVFARTVTPHGPTLHGASEVNVPVSCGGVCVLPGDIVVADSEGVIVIPLRNMDAALVSVRDKAHMETVIPTPAGREVYTPFFKRMFSERTDIEVLDSSWETN